MTITVVVVQIIVIVVPHCGDMVIGVYLLKLQPLTLILLFTKHNLATHIQILCTIISLVLLDMLQSMEYIQKDKELI
ncbi:MAG: hypothetical protein EBY07_07325 [Actinobacteria bacterium]|nr:hypothetical protein [Actinomycetota bacterium]